jgi:N-acetylglucosaminyldiphosphoundecaprenol N-acetyl-beta-D-mannosaminyltransferase
MAPVTQRPHGEVFGNEFYAGTLSDAAEAVVERALSGEGGYATLTGTHGLTSVAHDPLWKAALASAWYNFPDGAPVAWRLRRSGAVVADRIPGPDLMPLVISTGRTRGLRHFLFGSTSAVLEGLQVRLTELYPGAQIAGAYSPPFREFTPADDEEIRGAILASDPHIVWVGLGAPKQDIWMYRHAPELPGALCVGVGAAFDFISGNKQRAPRWMQELGMEWAHRMAREPRALGPRYAMVTSRFLALMATDLLRPGRRGRRGVA